MSEYTQYPRKLHIYSLRSEALKIAWKCAAIAKQMMLHSKTRTAHKDRHTDNEHSTLTNDTDDLTHRIRKL